MAGKTTKKKTTKKGKVSKNKKEEDEDNTEHWEWTDGIEDDPLSKSRLIHTSARRVNPVDKAGDYKVGDIIQIESGTATWIAIIRNFERSFRYNEEWEQWRANIVWFQRQQDILSGKRRKGAGAVCT